MDRDLNIWTYSDVGEAPFDGDLATYDAVLAELAADPVELILPERQKLPIVISSPHSGDIYPPSFIENAVLDERTLRKSEDCHVHQIAGAAFGAAGQRCMALPVAVAAGHDDQAAGGMERHTGGRSIRLGRNETKDRCFQRACP